MIGTLTDLEMDRRGAGWQIEIKSEWMGLSDAAGAGINLASCEERKQCSQYRRGELSFTPHQVIFMTTESCAGVMIDVVLNKRNPIASLQLAQRLQEQSIARKIVNNGIA